MLMARASLKKNRCRILPSCDSSWCSALSPRAAGACRGVPRNYAHAALADAADDLVGPDFASDHGIICRQRQRRALASGRSQAQVSSHSHKPPGHKRAHISGRASS